MVEHQLPKLMTGVRFPSPAPKKETRPDRPGFFFCERWWNRTPAQVRRKRRVACAPGKKQGLAERGRMYDHPIPLSRSKTRQQDNNSVRFQKVNCGIISHLSSFCFLMVTESRGVLVAVRIYKAPHILVVPQSGY